MVSSSIQRVRGVDRMRRITTLVVFMLALALAISAQEPARPQEQQPPPPPPPDAQAGTPAQGANAAGQPVFRAGINCRRVDVIGSDKAGNPVADLKQTDFEVTEDGKPQTVETCRLVKVDTASP